MPSFTKKAIFESFLALASKKPLEKLTVRDIVDHCGINRNTFYYHFQDIYAVFEGICEIGLSFARRDLPTNEMLSDLFFTLTTESAKHRRATENLFASLGRDGIERYTAVGLDELIAYTMKNEFPGCSERDLRLTAAFIRHAFLGLFADYIHHPDRLDATAFAAHISRSVRGVCLSLFEAENTDKNV